MAVQCAGATIAALARNHKLFDGLRVNAHPSGHYCNLTYLTDAFAALGISRKDFMAVARNYCADLGRLAEADDSTTLLDPARTDQIIAAVTDPAQRLVVAHLLMAVLAVDNRQGEGELVLFAHILDVWSLTRDQIANTA